MSLPMRRFCVWLAIVCLAGYFLLFYAVEMPSLTQATGKPFLRAQLLVHYLLLPEELLEIWFGTPAQFSLLDRLPVLLLAAGIFAWSIAAGWISLKWLGLDHNLTRIELIVFAAAVGLNLVSTYVLVIGLLGWLVRLAFVVPAAVTFAVAWGVWRKRKRLGPRLGLANQAWSPILLGGIPFAAILVLGAMLPPWDFDVREYHLQAPKEFFLQGRIGFLPHNVYANMPLGTEMHALLAMVLAGDWWWGALAGKTILASYPVLTAIGLWAAGQRFACPTAAAVAALVYLSVPWVIQVSTLGLVDAALGAYLFLAVYALAMAGENPAKNDKSSLGEKRKQTPTPSQGKAKLNHRTPGLDSGGLCNAKPLASFLLVGYLAGSAAACKYPGLLFVVVPLTAWVFLAFRDPARPWRRLAWKPALAVIVAAAAACGPWFVKNAALTGNPTYPLLYSIFGGKTWTPEKDRQWNAIHRPHDFSAATLGKDLGRVALTSEWQSPLVVPLAFLGFFAVSTRRWAVGLGAYFALIIALWWLLTHRIDRFWIPGLPLAAMLAGLGAAWSQERAWRIAVIAFLIAGLAGNFLIAASVGGGYNPYFVPLARLRTDPQRVDAWHLFLNREAKRGGVLLVGDAQPFDLEMPVFYNTCFDDSIFERLVKGRSPDEVRAALAELRITHVYVHWGEIARYRRTYGFTDFVQPAVFDALVASGVLLPLPEIRDHTGRGYRVADSP